MHIKKRLVVLATGMMLSMHQPSSSQTYEQVEAIVRRQLEQEKLDAAGDCSRVMVSWLKLRFSEADQDKNKPGEACAFAQRFSLRNEVPFLDVLPKIAFAMGGKRIDKCLPTATEGSNYKLYSGCYIPEPPSAWDIARAKEVKELGPVLLAHLKQCGTTTATSDFSFDVDKDGLVKGIKGAAIWAQEGLPPKLADELKGIERNISASPKCSPFPVALRGRYVLIAPDKGNLVVQQVRPDDAKWQQ